MRQLLATLGFSNIREVGEWERVTIGAVTVVAVPFRGEDWGMTLASRTYLVTTPELTIYLNADSVSDDESYDRLADEFQIDLAFLGVSGAQEAHAMPPGYGYGGFYLPWLPAAKHNEWIQLCNGPREAADAARRLRARFAFGYAAGGISGYKLAYTDRGSHRELAELLTPVATVGDGDRDEPQPLELPLGRAVTLGAVFDRTVRQ